MRKWVSLAGIVFVAVLCVPVEARAQGVQRTPGGVQIDFQNTDMRLVVAALAEAAGLNVVYADLPTRPVTLRTSTPVAVSAVRGYLESLLRANGMELREEQPGLLRIVSTAAEPDRTAVSTQVPVAPGGQARVFVHRLRHAPAEDIARSLGALFGIDGDFYGNERPRSLTDELRDQRVDLGENDPRRAEPAPRPGLDAVLDGPVQIYPDARTNSLLIRATPGDYATIRDAIGELDTRPLQVLIEVVIAEVRRDRQFGLGVDVRVPNQLDKESGAVIGGDLIGTSTGDVVLRVLGLGAVKAEVVLRALSASGEVTILSRPVVLAQNNEEARIMVGDQRPFIQISRALPTDNAARDQVIQYRDVGTQLTIRPTINPDGYVTLTVLQEVSTATDQTQFGAPVISTREAETRLLVKDGHTVVIGGLIDQQRTSTASGIPLLKDIPWIGGLFRSTTNRNTVSEMFLFLVPHVIYTDEDVDATTDRVRERTPRLDRALPDSIPLFWEERGDTLVAPPVPPAPPRPPAERPAPSDQPAPAGSAPAPARRSPRRRARRRTIRDRRGFTLPELLTVIVVLGIAAAAAIPALRPPAERSAGAAADALRRAYAEARSDAASRGMPVVVEVETAGGAFLVRTAPVEGAADTLRRGALPLPPEARLLGGREGVARAAFDATGRARADEITVVHGEVRHAVRVDPWTGAARTAP